MQLPTEDLDDIVTLAAKLKEATVPTPKTLTYLELRSAIAADSTLKQQAAALTTRFGADKTAKFWKTVEARIHTLEDFRALLVMSDDEITRWGKLDTTPRKSAAEIAAAISDGVNTVLKATPTDPLQKVLGSGDPAVAGSKAHAKAFAERMRDKFQSRR